MIRLLIADDEALERETLADIVAARQRIRRCCGAQT